MGVQNAFESALGKGSKKIFQNAKNHPPKTVFFSRLVRGVGSLSEKAPQKVLTLQLNTKRQTTVKEIPAQPQPER